VIRAARYLGVAPWELNAQPLAWQEWALVCEAAEIGAQNEAAQEAVRKRR
jgi:hypothetical protein